MAQTWICRDCVSSFGNVDEWRRQVKKTELFRAGIGIAAMVGVSVLVLRTARNAIRSRHTPDVRAHSPAFI